MPVAGLWRALVVKMVQFTFCPWEKDVHDEYRDRPLT
jgi:hypothetical protein